MAVQYVHFQVNRNTSIYIRNHKVKKTDKLITFHRTVQHKSWVQQQCYRSLKTLKCQPVWHNIQSLLLGVQSLSQTQKQACRHTNEWASAHKHIPVHTLKLTHILMAHLMCTPIHKDTFFITEWCNFRKEVMPNRFSPFTLNYKSSSREQNKTRWLQIRNKVIQNIIIKC